MMTPEEKRHDMLHSPVELLVCKMAVPTIITMLITALYNMADTYFVGRLDTVSTAAVGLALPLMNVIQAIGFSSATVRETIWHESWVRAM